MITARLKKILILLVLLTFWMFVQAQSKAGNDRRQPFDFDWKFSLADNATAKSRDFDDSSGQTPQLRACLA